MGMIKVLVVETPDVLAALPAAIHSGHFTYICRCFRWVGYFSSLTRLYNSFLLLSGYVGVDWWTMHKEKEVPGSLDWCYLSQLMPDVQQFSDLTGAALLTQIVCQQSLRPQNAKYIYKQFPLHLAPLFGELFPQKCKHCYTRPSMGKSARVGCIHDKKMQSARLKSKQPDELKSSALGRELKSDEMFSKHVNGRVLKTPLIMSLQFAVCKLFPVCSFVRARLSPHPFYFNACTGGRVSDGFIIVFQALSWCHIYFIWCLFS